MLWLPCEEKGGTGRDGDGVSDELVPEMADHAPGLRSTSPRWIDYTVVTGEEKLCLFVYWDLEQRNQLWSSWGSAPKYHFFLAGRRPGKVNIL